MYPGTVINWHDESEIMTSANIVELENKPLFMVVSSFDKGPEDFRVVEGANFASLYGKMSFIKHGQNAIQAQNMINAGAALLVKRVCAEDATIANVVLCAKVSTTETQKMDEDGNAIYLDEAGEETLEVTENPVMVSSTSIKWTASSISGCKTLAEVKDKAIEELYSEEDGTYPLFIYTDNGRGISSKAVRLVPDYYSSKNIGKTFYTAVVYEGTSTIEKATVTFNPEVVYNGNLYGITEGTLEQLNAEVPEDMYEAFATKIAEGLGVEVEEVKAYDLVYGYTHKGSAIEGLVVDAESIDLDSSYGIELKEGTNGNFGDKPVNTEHWTDAIVAVFEGRVSDEVWDVDQYKIGAILDANFPLQIKEAIAKFVTFREDCVFFRDIGVGKKTFLEIKNTLKQNTVNNRFIADYITSYQIVDPQTKKNIEVTMMYDFAECVVQHLAGNRAHNPLAGSSNGFVLKNAIKGTVNYTPRVTPQVNQKQALDDLRANYAIFENDQCVVQSCYSCNERYTQLSYISNVIAIQEVVRAVRTQCPKNRFILIDGTDLSDYSKAVDNVLANFRSNFDTLEFEYTEDKLRAMQKIFYASIRFAFHNWAQSEIFDVYAIGNE